MLNFLNKRRRKGQSTLEYAVLIIIIIAALFSIQLYIKRGIQGRLKSATDDIGDQFSPGNTNYHQLKTTLSNVEERNTQLSQLTNMLTTEQSVELTNSSIMNSKFEYFAGSGQ